MRKSILIALFFALCAVNSHAQIAPTPGMKISAATQFKAGDYRGEGDFLQVSGADFTLDLKNVRFIGPGKQTGIGLHITDARNVTILNAAITGYQWGLVMERCERVTLRNCRVAFNGDLPPGTVIDENGRSPEDQHGGGIVLRDCKKCRIQGAKSNYQWDGIDVIRSDDNVIEAGDFSYNGNWGVHFWNSSRNVFRDNRAIWCTTGAGKLYQALTGWQTYDAQAVAIDHNSNENVISGNDLRFGGDGIFIRANEGPITPGTAVPVLNGSNRNILRDNDCSFSPNNAIEADFVADTVIEGNNVSDSHYGMWLGYSQRSVIKSNIGINNSANAVEIENGQGAVFENNVFGYDAFRDGGQAILLRQNGRDKTLSQGYKIRHNVFFGASNSVTLLATQAEIAENQILPTNSRAVIQALERRRRTMPADTQAQRDKITVLEGRIEALQAREIPPLKPIAIQNYSGPDILTGTKLDAPIPLSGLKYGPPALMLDSGISLWTRKVSADRVTYQIPADFSVLPSPTLSTIYALTRDGWQPIRVLKLARPKIQPGIGSVLPDRALLPGEKVAAIGGNLTGGRLLLNGEPIAFQQESLNRLVFTLPASLKPGTGVNLLWERGAGLDYERVAPIILTITTLEEIFKK